MATQPSEIVTGQDLVGMLQAWIDSRRMGEMEIMQTPFSWVTILLGIQKEGNSEFLLVEPVPQFESFLSRSPGQEVSFEFLENGILCKFRSRVIRCQPQAIWLALPSSIQRIQKREHFRIFPTSEAQIIFRIAGKEEKARVKDYSLKGVSFFMEGHQKFHPEDELTDLILTLPQGRARVSYPISRAIVRRVDEHFEGQRRVCALEFSELEKRTQRELARQTGEIVTGQDLVGMLQAWINSRRMGKMEIMQTPFSWVTILLGIQKEGNSEFLLVDPVAGFESFLSRSPGQEVSFEYLENGILCKFRSRVIRCQPQAIWLALPSSIQRIQKREHFRISPTSEAQIIFRIAGKEEKARVKDYSLGGVSFFMETHQKLHLEDELTDLILTLPQGRARDSYPISRAIVRRVDEQFEGQKRLCALEFSELEKRIQEGLARHLFEEQRSLLRQGRKI